MCMVRISQNNKLRVAYINTVTYLVTTIICHQYVQNFASSYHNSRHTVKQTYVFPHPMQSELTSGPGSADRSAELRHR
jgi:hypothetical protein